MALMFLCTADNQDWRLIAELKSASPCLLDPEDKEIGSAIEKGGYAVQVLTIEEAIARNLPTSLDEVCHAAR